MDIRLTPSGPNDDETVSRQMQRYLSMAEERDLPGDYHLSGATDDPENCFLPRLVAAAEAVLDSWSLSLLNARYGLYVKRSASVEEIATASGLSTTMVNAHLELALQRLSRQGITEIRKGRLDLPCAQLVNYVRSIVRPGEPGDTQRLVSFSFRALAHVTPHLDLPDMVRWFVDTEEEQQFRSILTRAKLAAATEEEEDGEPLEATVKHYRVADKLLDELLVAVEWPDYPKRLDPSDFHSLVYGYDSDRPAFTLQFWSEKSGDDAYLASEAQSHLLMLLEGSDRVVHYVQGSADVIGYTTPELDPNDAELVDFPDVAFVVVLDDGRVVVIDLVPFGEVAQQLWNAPHMALRRSCRRMGYGLLITDGRNTALSLSRIPLRDSVAFLVNLRQLSALLGGDAYIDLDGLDLTHYEMSGYVIREGLDWLAGTHLVSTQSIFPKIDGRSPGW